MGLKINPYNTCVANKTIHGKQCTIVWYLDDINVSHTDKSVVIEVMNAIAYKFRGLLKKIGSKHTYLGMNITIEKNGTFSICMS